MDLLEQRKLFGDGLVPVDTPEIVERYNDALGELGVTRTNLSSFSVDGTGWSPEIAEELGNRLYLSHGGATQLGIIVSPDQCNKPVFCPFTSIDRALMETFFARNEQAIADITKQQSIRLVFDRQLSRFRSPQDLLLVSALTLKPSAGDLATAAKAQRALVKRFESEPDAWADVTLRQQIIASGNEYGDLRYRHVTIPDMRFEVTDFYANLFGGVFVFRSASGDPLLIVQDPKSATSGCETVLNVDMFDTLLNRHIINVDLEWFTQHLDELHAKRRYLEADIICKAHPDCSYSELKDAQRARMFDALEVPDLYFELERLIAQCAQGRTPDRTTLSHELQWLLAHPCYRNTALDQEVAWQLICRVSDYDVLRLYISDKEMFFERYQDWSPAKQRWAVDLVDAAYLKRMNGKKRSR